MEITVSEMMQFVQGVEQYYNNAWTKLIYFGVAIFIIGTIAIPIGIQLWQKQQLKIQSEIIKKDLKKKIDEMVESKFESYTTEYEKKFVELKNEITKALDLALGSICHIRGSLYFDKKYYSTAMKCYLDAANYYISSRDDFNLQNTLHVLSENLLPKLTDYDVIEEYKDIYQKTISSLEKANDRGQYRNYIRKLKKAFKVAKNRLEPDKVKK